MMCVVAGNTRLVFALSVAFAGALAEIAGEDSGGFHLRGASSSGIPTALTVLGILARIAAVWGRRLNFSRCKNRCMERQSTDISGPLDKNLYFALSFAP
ncbi:DUF927 domain-containing protein [Nitrosospira sp. NpAV]|uniref:DUF927 domain-containing protein n=1 Tax=Nitrosospira sp. NpAV TaxID=58133 RepID=UPI0009FE220B|nr:DUF927 domain-containing protein [Nitrosospira sp. NpAV]